jgi:UDP-N-acetylmuramoyl-L-alanyl-D-glutamate--2,6-diaminopimelate ligase
MPIRPAHVRPRRLHDIARWLGVAAPGTDAAVTGITHDSRAVRAGDLFAALPGATGHGARFAAAAAGSGAVAALTDRAGAGPVAQAALPAVVVDHPRRVLGALAARIYGDPARALTLIGVTGTHGKTTTTALMESGAEAAGRAAARIGTNGTYIRGRAVSSRLTTPEAPDLHALYAVMRESGVQVCAMEVSSHALVMGRVDGVLFDLAVFTNLGRDHLDFHADLEDYFAAKASLFTQDRARRALVNVDDEYGRRLLDRTELETRTFSAAGGPADWRASGIELTGDGATFTVVDPDGAGHPARVRLSGHFNVANALAAVAALTESGMSLDDVIDGVGNRAGVDGRMERIGGATAEVLVIVDYAHKPDAVRAALEATRRLCTGTLTIVLGAGGDRDRGKRHSMGEIASRFADRLIVTDDNPRTEDPATIRAALLQGAGSVAAAERAEVLEIGDRRAAIARAIGDSRSGDCVIVAGKGHEQGQEIAGVVHPFDDRVAARAALDDLGLPARDEPTGQQQAIGP